MNIFNIVLTPIHIYVIILNIQVLIGTRDTYENGVAVILICMITMGLIQSIRGIIIVGKRKLPLLKMWYVNITIKESGD